MPCNLTISDFCILPLQKIGITNHINGKAAKQSKILRYGTDRLIWGFYLGVENCFRPNFGQSIYLMNDTKKSFENLYFTMEKFSKNNFTPDAG